MQWLLEGFNSALITFGQAATGKSLALFGAGQQLEQPLLLSMLKDLFQQARSSADYRVGMACWELQDGRVRGLLAAEQPAGSDHGSCAGEGSALHGPEQPASSSHRSFAGEGSPDVSTLLGCAADVACPASSKSVADAYTKTTSLWLFQPV